MVKTKRNLVGETFGQLTVLARADDYVSPKGVHCHQWLCKCSCGNSKVVNGYNLSSGKTTSCGCVQKCRTVMAHRKYNDYEIQDDYVIMYTQKGEMFLIDIDDFWRVKQHCWCSAGAGYFVSRINQKNIRLHNFIMGANGSLFVDHIGGESSRYDNRKINLRFATTVENCRNADRSKYNTSGVIGVYKHRNKWQARIYCNNTYVYLGSFNTIEEATIARKTAEDKYFGEFSYTNSQKLAKERSQE